MLAAAGTIALAGTAPRGAVGVEHSSYLDWVAFDETEALAQAANGRPVFVDFTADWCLTCKANERLVLETETMAEAFEAHNVVAMKGDWTNRDDTITEFLARYGRAAVPFYVLYGTDGGEPHILGEILTTGGLLKALDEASAGSAE